MYEPGLSQAALSILSVDSILSADTQALQRKYHTAIESHQRVNDAIFVRDLQLVADIQRHYLNLRRFAKTYLGDFEKSSFAKVVIAKFWREKIMYYWTEIRWKTYRIVLGWIGNNYRPVGMEYMIRYDQ